MDQLQELVRLHRMGTGAREVARLLQISPNTERAYRKALRKAGLLRGPIDSLPALEELRAAVKRALPPAPLPEHQRSRIEDWNAVILELMKKSVSPRAIFDRLRTEHPDFAGTYPQVKRMCRTLRKKEGPSAEQIAIPVETAAGEIAQVDFGHVGKLLDSDTMTMREAYVFVMVLGYSRTMITRVVFDQRTETWLQLHVEALTELGGVPQVIVPDNLKAAVVRAAFALNGPPSELNRSYRELARHYGFKIDPTPPYAPQKKGKVESGVKYVKRSFFRGREQRDVAEIRPALALWTREVANQRTHGTTHQIPQHRFDAEERSTLLALPARPFESVVWKKVTVHADAHVSFERRLYSVPWKLTGKELWLRATSSTVAIDGPDDARVATHARRGQSPRSTIEEHLPAHRADLRHRSREYWQERAAKMGEDVVKFIGEVFDSDDVLSQLRTVQAIVMHLETFPVERARAACRRASHFACYSYAALKNVLRQALDLEPLPGSSAPSTSWASTAPQFARPIDDIVSAKREARDESN
jgi:transposase